VLGWQLLQVCNLPRTQRRSADKEGMPWYPRHKRTCPASKSKVSDGEYSQHQGPWKVAPAKTTEGRYTKPSARIIMAVAQLYSMLQAWHRALIINKATIPAPLRKGTSLA
jgi:hypothetical protein